MRIFAVDFRNEPYWWEGFRPPLDAPTELPAAAEVVVIGGGYAGIVCALTLAEAGIETLVLEAGALGQGASSRSGGQITGGVNVQNKAARAGSHLPPEQQAAARAGKLRDCAEAMTWFEDQIARHAIDCGYRRTGRLTGLWTREHGEAWLRRLDELNSLTAAEARMMSREELREELGSDLYHGAVLIGRAGHLDPGRLYGGLLAAAQRAGARIHGGTKVLEVARQAGGFALRTPRGTVRAGQVVIATNGYPSAATGHLRRSLAPVTSHMIATEELPPDLARSLIPRNRAVTETRRVGNHFRLSPDGRRLLFGGRARFTPASEATTARLLHRMMVRRFPQLEGTRISHSWDGNVAMTLDHMPHIGDAEGLHWAFGCNGSGVVMMSWLGHMVARKIVERPDAPICAYDGGRLPRHPLYFGNPWFLFALGSWYQFQDAWDRRRSPSAGAA